MSISGNITEFLNKGVEDGVFSGAQAAWRAGSGRRIVSVFVGETRVGEGREINSDTLFDIASVTKAFAASAVLRLVDRGVLALESRLDEHMPVLKGLPQGSATLAQLLAHEAGFVPWLPMFEAIPAAKRGAPAAKEAIVNSALTAAPDANPGVRALYSDLGFIALSHLVETVSAISFDRVVEREVTGPLEMKSVCFRPLSFEDPLVSSSNRAGEGFMPSLKSIAATEACPWRGRLLQGEVHDDNAWSMGGISGHAGLFATAEDVARLGAAWLDAIHNGAWISRELARKAVERRSLGRGLGWDLKDLGGSSAGSRMGPRSFGHLGFSGCSLWVDPDTGLSAALNTNRVHMGRDNMKIRDFRPGFHDLLAGGVDRDNNPISGKRNYPG
jgi:CubicO group peptidase (beta-lactamase class C family)